MLGLGQRQGVVIRGLGGGPVGDADDSRGLLQVLEADVGILVGGHVGLLLGGDRGGVGDLVAEHGRVARGFGARFGSGRDVPERRPYVQSSATCRRIPRRLARTTSWTELVQNILDRFSGIQKINGSAISCFLNT